MEIGQVIILQELPKKNPIRFENREAYH